MDTEPRTHMIHGPGHLGSWGMLRKDRDEQSLRNYTSRQHLKPCTLRVLSDYKCTKWHHFQYKWHHHILSHLQTPPSHEEKRSGEQSRISWVYACSGDITLCTYVICDRIWEKESLHTTHEFLALFKLSPQENYKSLWLLAWFVRRSSLLLNKSNVRQPS